MGTLFYYITVPFGYLMKFCCLISPGHNYLVALIFFTLIVQILLCLIFGIKQQKNMQKQASLAPKIAAIRKKYAGRTDRTTQQQMQQEIMNFQQENGYSPLGGCLPLLIQLPIIMALYNVIVSPLRYMYMIAEDTINEVIIGLNNAGGIFSDASAKGITEAIEAGKTVSQTSVYRTVQYEIINNIGNANTEGLTGKAKEAVTSLQNSTLPDYTLFGIDFSANPEIKSILVIVPILIVATMILSTIITRKFSYQDPATKDQQNSCTMKGMTYVMPLLSAWISLSLPAAVGVYWIYRSIAATLQQMLMSKIMPMPKFTEEDYKAAEKEMLGSSKKKKPSSTGTYTGEKKRSLHHIDDDDGDYPQTVSTVTKKEPETDEEDNTPKLNGKEMKVTDGEAPVLKEDKHTRYKKK